MGTKGNMNSGARGLAFWKRALDLTCILLVAPGLLLICAGVAMLIRLGSSGPVFFRQQRVGYKGRQFTCYKFRTMLLDADIEAHRRHTQHLIRSHDPMVKLDAHNDPRLVPFGALLRACGLDELPQILNIVKGEMSLVGPRPCIPYECELYQPWHHGRFDAVPGLTGLWQVSGKNRTTFDQMVRLDIEYCERLSLLLDLKILLRTFPALWGQYSSLHDLKRQETDASARGLRKSIQTYNS